MSCHLILPAAGVGRRFGGSLPKQYCEVHGQTIMEWTLSVFDQLPLIESIVLVLAAGDQQGIDIAGKYPNVVTVTGGDERSDSVLAGLEWLVQAESEEHWVMVHDIARPCVSAEDISRLYQHCVQTGHGGVLANPVTDTVKRQISDVDVETIDRSTLWTVQTPQCFRAGELLSALNRCAQLQIPITDEASALESSGGKVQLVPGSRRNIKLTHAEDLPLIEFFLTSKESKL